MDKLIIIVIVLLAGGYAVDRHSGALINMAILLALGTGGSLLGVFLYRQHRRSEMRERYDGAIAGFAYPDTRHFIGDIAARQGLPAEALAGVAEEYEATRDRFMAHWREFHAVHRYDRHNFENTLTGARSEMQCAQVIGGWYSVLANTAASLMKAMRPPPAAAITWAERTGDPLGHIEGIIGQHRPVLEPHSHLANYLPEYTAEHVRMWSGFDGTVGHHRLALPDDVRFEHQWVVAPSGAGKTTLLQTQIAEDLHRVARGECSVIVIDSQNQLIQAIARCALFAPGAPLHGKLVLLEPDPEHPPALNVLDVGTSALNDRERFMAQAEAIENVKSCLSTMNDMQDDLLSYMVEFCFAIPGATIQTLVDLLKPDGLKQYSRYLPAADQTCRDFFATSFDNALSRTTKEAVSRRLLGMLRNPTFRRMFLNARSRFSMARELREPKVILINTDLAYLKKDACQLFGRFFIAQLLQAAGSRDASSLPVFCYVDECHDYIAEDENAAMLMDKARKRKVGMVFAHQRMANIRSPNVTDALSNVGVRMAGGNETDAASLARIFRCRPEFIRDMERGRFAFFARRLTTQGAIEIQVPPNALEGLGRMSDHDHEALRREMRQRFTAPFAGEPDVREDAAPSERPPLPSREEDGLRRAMTSLGQLGAQVTRLRPGSSGPAEPEPSPQPFPEQEDARPAKPAAHPQASGPSRKSEKDPSEIPAAEAPAPQNTPAAKSKAPAAKITVTAKRATRAATDSPGQRKKTEAADDADTMGSKPSTEW